MKKFKDMTRAEKRAAVCEDALKRVTSKTLVMKPGMFFNGSCPVGKDFKEFVNSKICNVCAKGALFFSWFGSFEKKNQLKGENVNNLCADEFEVMERVSPALTRIFGRRILDNIEAAFEGTSYSWHYSENKAGEYAKAFRGYKFEDILEYIVENKGEFPLPSKI